MVHALQEAQRVTTPEALLIDLRPIALDVPLELVVDGDSITVGVVNGTRGKPHDDATDRALVAVSDDLALVAENSFHCSVNYDSIDDMLAHLPDSSRHALNPGWDKQLIQKHTENGRAHLRYYEKIRLNCYKKR